MATIFLLDFTRASRGRWEGNLDDDWSFPIEPKDYLIHAVSQKREIAYMNTLRHKLWLVLTPFLSYSVPDIPDGESITLHAKPGDRDVRTTNDAISVFCEDIVARTMSSGAVPVIFFRNLGHGMNGLEESLYLEALRSGEIPKSSPITDEMIQALHDRQLAVITAVIGTGFPVVFLRNILDDEKNDDLPGNIQQVAGEAIMFQHVIVKKPADVLPIVKDIVALE